MRRSLGRLRRRVFGISADEASFKRRAFRGGDERIRGQLERIGRTFLDGYHAALEEDRPQRLATALSTVEPESRGFAFEGAGMGLFLLDLLSPWKRDRLRRFLAGPAAPHAYMVHVGAGRRWRSCTAASIAPWRTGIPCWGGWPSMVTAFTRDISVGPTQWIASAFLTG